MKTWKVTTEDMHGESTRTVEADDMTLGDDGFRRWHAGGREVLALRDWSVKSWGELGDAPVKV